MSARARNRQDRVSDGTNVAWWALLTAILKSMWNRPLAWLVATWLSGWALVVWHAIHSASWDTVWVTVNNVLARAHGGLPGADYVNHGNWLHEVAQWGQVALYVSTGLLALYVSYAMWVWWRYTNAWMPEVREERLRGGRLLEVLIPRGSKADARAAADMLRQLWNLLSDMAGAGAGFGRKNVGAERLALSLEMWCTPHTGEKVGFYVWCPASAAHQRQENSHTPSNKKGDIFIDEVRELIKAYHPRCLLRWVDDPLEKALIELTRPADIVGVVITWYELGLLADSRYAIGSGALDERLLTGSQTVSRSGSPGAGSDPLAAVIGMLSSDKTDKDVPAMGIQVVIAACPETSGKAQEAINKELARLRELEMQAGRKVLGPQHEARVLALEEKTAHHVFDVIIRLVAIEPVNGIERMLGYAPANRADARLASLFRQFKQYDRSIAGVKQGFHIVRKARASLSAANTRPPASSSSTISPGSLRRVGPVLGRWPRGGICLPKLLPFMRIGKPCLLNMAELATVYHFPHQGLEGVAALRWGTYHQIPAPAQARVTAEQVAEGRKVVLGRLDDDIPPAVTASPARVGTPASPGQTRPTARAIQTARTTEGNEGANVLSTGMQGVGTNFEDLRRGTYVLGPMGSGKSVFLYNMVLQHMAAGRGVGILDGKGDSYEEVLRLVPPHLEGKVLTFDPENRSRSGGRGGRSIGINPLDGRVAAQLGIERVESLTMSLMRKMMGANWEGAVLMQRFLRDAITAVLDVEPMPTMLNLWRWLQDDGKGGNEYRDALVDKIQNRLVQDFWQRQVPAMSSQLRSSMQNVLTRVDRYVKNDVRYLLLQPHSTVNFQEIMDLGTIFVGKVSPRLGEDQPFLGALVLNGFLMGAFARQSIPHEQRRDYLLMVDEFQNFVDTARADVERMLSMARGYRLGLMLAHQYTDQLPKEVLSAILKNVQTWVVFGLQADDARLFASYMEGLDAEDFYNLPPYYTYQRTIVENRSTGVYSAAPLPLPLPVPAATPWQRKVRSPWNVREEEVLRAAHAPERVRKLMHGEPEESEGARRARTLKLAREVYWQAEECNPDAVQVLSLLSDMDRELYRQARQLLDKEEREFILAHPQLIRDKVERIERLSALRWGTPCAEVDALILAALHVHTHQPGGGTKGHTGPVKAGAPPFERYSLLPEFSAAGPEE